MIRVTCLCAALLAMALATSPPGPTDQGGRPSPPSPPTPSEKPEVG